MISLKIFPNSVQIAIAYTFGKTILTNYCTTINFYLYAVIPASDLISDLLTTTQYQMLKLTPIRPMPEYLGKIDSVGY